MIIIIYLLVVVILFFKVSTDDWIEIITPVVSISSVVLIYLYNNNAKNQVEQHKMQIKKENYNRFIDKFIDKENYMTAKLAINPCKEAVQAYTDYCKELSKINTYASKEVIDFLYCLSKLEEFKLYMYKMSKVPNEEKKIRIYTINCNQDIIHWIKCGMNPGIDLRLTEIKNKLLNSQRLLNLLEQYEDRYKIAIEKLKNEKNMSSLKFECFINILDTSALFYLIRKDLKIDENEALSIVIQKSNYLIINGELCKIEDEIIDDKN